jgi:hypothetical protein
MREWINLAAVQRRRDFAFPKNNKQIFVDTALRRPIINDI